MDERAFKRIFLEEKRTKGFSAPENLFLVLNFVLANYSDPIKKSSLRRRIKAKWNIDRRENTIRASIRDLEKLGLLRPSTERPALVRLDLHEFVLYLTHYYVKTSDRKIFAAILTKLMPGYGRFLSDAQAFEKNSMREFYLYIDPIQLEWIVDTIRKGLITRPIRELIEVLMERPIESIFILILGALLYLSWHLVTRFH